jgi:O-acetyl-ADP-ribose deacetylase (regulator of RNase III)
VGAAVVTAAGGLEAEFMIHAVVWSENEPVTPTGLTRAIVSVLQRAADWGLARITMPVLGIGPGALPIEDAARILVDVLSTNLPNTTYPSEVCIVVESEEEREVVQALLRGSVTQ